MKALTAAILTLAISTSSAFATAQYPDKILYDGQEYNLHTNPMEPYFAEHPDRKPETGFSMTALWRGYVATFAFKANRLVLEDIGIRIRVERRGGKPPYEWKSILSEVLPEGDTLQVDWFTGILVLPYGERVKYVHMGYGSTYSNYILLEVKNGKLTGQRNLDHDQYVDFKERQFQAYKKTKAYKQQVARLKQHGGSQEFVDSFLRDFVVSYTSEFLDEDESANESDAGYGQ